MSPKGNYIQEALRVKGPGWDAKAEVTSGFVSTLRHPSTGSGTELKAPQAQRT